ncbi:MAG: LUD domain-containing protein [Hyphomicrobiaceae bacterium]|nr:LUD domain-containing protein [Hyphomicrobiaceae bacterium]
MTNRSDILGKIKASRGQTDEAARVRAVAARLALPPRQPAVARVGAAGTNLRAVFEAEATRNLATVMATATADDIPPAIASYLRQHNQPPGLRHGADPLLSAIDWTSAPGLAIAQGAADPADTAGLSVAAAGVAETGTLVLASGADNPVTLGFLPETHIVVLRAADIVATYEDAYDRIRARLGPAQMPRTLNLISGPSRTADIGGRIVIGAHGPRRMAVLILDS